MAKSRRPIVSAEDIWDQALQETPLEFEEPSQEKPWDALMFWVGVVIGLFWNIIFQTLAYRLGFTS